MARDLASDRVDARLLWPAVHVVLRLALGGIFLWAGLAKAFDVQGSMNSVDAYRVLPDGLIRPVAVALPSIEILLGLFLILGLFTRVAAVGTGLLILVFLAGLAQAKARGLPIDCGCFGAGGAGDGVGWFDLLRDAALFAAAAFLAWRPHGPLQLDNVIFDGGAR